MKIKLTKYEARLLWSLTEFISRGELSDRVTAHEVVFAESLRDRLPKPKEYTA